MPKKKTTTARLSHPPLVRVPHFDYIPADPDGDLELSIKVCYYNGGIHICNGERSIIIPYEDARPLFTSILHHIPEAQAALQ